MLKTGSSGRVDAEQLQPPAWNRIRCVAGSWMTRAAMIFQLGLFGQPVSVSHRAGRIDRMLEDRDRRCAGAPRGGDTAAAFEHDQQILDRAVAERVGQDDVGRRSACRPAGVTTTTLPSARTSPVLRSQLTWSAAR